MVTLENLSYQIKDKKILHDISCSFESGEIHLILGPNGVGKSTLVKLISSELKPTKGKIYIQNQPIQKFSLKELATFRAVLSQNIELSFPLSVFEVVLMGRYPHFEGKPNYTDLSICEHTMQLFDVFTLKDRNYLTLSGGEKQRVQFARVFAQIWKSVENKPRLLLLDEPLTFLDVFYQYDLMDKLKEFVAQNPDITVIGVIHDLNIAAKFSDKVLLLKNQEIADYGCPKDILTEKNILKVFNIVIKNHFEVL